MPEPPLINPPDWLVTTPPAASEIPTPLLAVELPLIPPELMIVPADANAMPTPAPAPVSATLPRLVSTHAVPPGPLIATPPAAVLSTIAVRAMVVGLTSRVTPLL